MITDLKTALTIQLDNYLNEREEILKTITKFGESKGLKFDLDTVQKNIVELSVIINKLEKK